MTRFDVIPSKAWRNKTTGQKVSPYGAAPWQSPSERGNWELIDQGFTIRDNKLNTVGMGRPPFKTAQDAQALIATRQS